MIVVLCVMAACGLLTWFVPFAFLTGGFFSGLSGFVGMRIATKANCRTANACREGLNRGLRVAFSVEAASWASRWWVWVCWISACGSCCCASCSSWRPLTSPAPC